ncbi:MAG: hypothetical protein JJU11_18185, partial [Candidatus Sumerlaeia bacterium]|nr:hypothetical protein [Candidatus Sumerlaeia bacterium]
MIRSSKAPLIGTVGTAAFLVAAGLFFFQSGDATAQNGNSLIHFNPGAGEMIYAASYINEIKPTSGKIHEVIPFPNTTVFLVRTDKTISVWERRRGEVVALMDIHLDKTLRNLEVLGDGRTFVVQTDDWV